MDDNTATNLDDLLPAAADAADAGAAPRMYLIVLAGGIPGAILPLAPGGTRLGRSSDNTLQLHEGSVSRHHAVLKVGDDGKVRLIDLASTNGTSLNGRRIPPHTPVPVRDGDRLRFGSSVVVKFSCPVPCEEQFHREMFERTVRDGLTGLYNRSYFLDQVAPLAEQAGRRGLGVSVLMIDIDHFKRVNDTFGHETGDAVLREVATVLRQCTRSQDLVARYGGEEFVVALPIASLGLATERAERIRRGLSARRILAQGAPLRITASIGVAFTPAGRPLPVEALIASADQSLYRAKDGGRDRVVSGRGSTMNPPEPDTREEEDEPVATSESRQFVMGGGE